MAHSAAGTNLLSSNFTRAGGPENSGFRNRNRIADSYHGPVHVVEDVQVLCAACFSPVNPVERVPVGPNFYHPQCLRCELCSRSSRTTVFRDVDGTPLCNSCYGSGGGARAVGRNNNQHKALVAHRTSHQHTLSSGLRLDTRSCTPRQAMLLERQTAFLQGDPNLLIDNRLPSSMATRQSSARRGSQSPQKALTIESRRH
jgi:hypothetical protein